MEITILYEDGLKGEIPSSDWLVGIAEKALVAENASPNSEVSILIAGQEKLHELNRTYLDEDRPTDVLSFPMISTEAEKTAFIAPPDGLVHLGEVVISLPQATEQAREHGHSTQREIAILAIHGVLHLLGYDHAEPEEETTMRARERKILDSLSEAV